MTRNELEIIDQYRMSAPVDIEKLIGALGIQFEKSERLNPEISGEIERLKGSNFVIRVNASHARTRQRFTAAHELGHYILHRLLIGNGVDDNKAYRSEASGNFNNMNIEQQHESEANQFAAVILMPSKLIKKETQKSKDVTELAKLFDVSSQAMEIRIKGLAN